MKLIIGTTKGQIDGPLGDILKIQKVFRIKSPGAFWIRMKGFTRWDGYNQYVTSAGYFAIGLLPKIYKYLIDNDYKFKIEDHRDYVPDPLPLLDYPFKPREYQREAVRSIVNNKIGKYSFPMGIIGAATNAGKSAIMAMLYLEYREKTLILINNKDMFDQLVKDIPEFTGDEVGIISAKKVIWNDLMIVMVPTLYNRINLYARRLAQYNMVLVDECDLGTSKSYKTVLQYLFHCTVRVGLTGSPFMRVDKNENERQREFFGDLVYTIRNKQLIDEGYSAKIKIRMVKGNTDVKCPGDYPAEVELGLIKNAVRNRRIVRRVMHHFHYKRWPMLIIAQRRKHIKVIYNRLRKKFDDETRIEWIDHKREGRKQIINDFRDGKIEILVGSMILKRGMNFPLIRYMANAGGGKSITNALQLLGRATRKSPTKAKTVYEDFYDTGAYLLRHSKRRLLAYKNEGLEVIEAYKDK